MSARLAAAAVVMLLGVAFAGCNPFGGSADTPEPTPAPSPAATPTPTATLPAPTPFPTPTAAEIAALADDLASMVLAAITEEFGEHLLEARALDLGLSDDDGSYWAVVTDGPQPVYENDDGEIINFFHIVAVYRLNTDRSWSSEIARVEIDTAPQRTGDTELVSVAPGSAWIVIRAGTGAHAGTLDVIRFDGAGGALETVLSHISSRPNAGEITDLDGDGFPEFVLNTSNPYVFCYACAVEEHSVAIHRWDGAALAEVPLQAPSGLTGSVATAAARVVSLAEADLWRQAAALAVATASRAPGEDGLRWLSILVNQNAARRLAHAGSPGQPLLTHVLAGEYAAALDLMRAHTPEDAFALDGPLVVGTAAETDLATMAVTILDYTERALGQRPDDASIHAVRALGLALAAPDELDRPRETAARAAELAPSDAFLREVTAYLDSIDQAPGLPPEAPAAEELLPGPTAEWFAEGYTLGSGDRGRFVRALQQRLARVRDLGFLDPGRYYDVYDTATREAVIEVQQQADLEPTGVVGRPDVGRGRSRVAAAGGEARAHERGALAARRPRPDRRARWSTSRSTTGRTPRGRPGCSTCSSCTTRRRRSSCSARAPPGSPRSSSAWSPPGTRRRTTPSTTSGSTRPRATSSCPRSPPPTTRCTPPPASASTPSRACARPTRR